MVPAIMACSVRKSILQSNGIYFSKPRFKSYRELKVLERSSFIGERRRKAKLLRDAAK